MSGRRTGPVIGIGDIATYLPENSIESETVVAERSRIDPENRERLERALEYTGQKRIRFTSAYEDSVTMAAESVRRLSGRVPAALPGVRHLASGTETGVDHSKPVASWVQGLLEKAGIELPRTLVTSQTQHACASGTLALFSTAGQLALAGRDGESGIVVCTDIARYAKNTTAEITQGAGSVALLVQQDPGLVGIDFATAGFLSRDVDDFFRPLGSDVAIVKGRFSIRCYREALEGAFLDHVARRGETPAAVLRETDIFVLHAPYYSLPLDSLEWLVGRQLGIGRSEAEAFLSGKGFQDSIRPAALAGNLYSGSMYLALQYALAGAVKRFGGDVVGKRILFASYGSGNTMIVFSGRVMERAPETVAGWEIGGLLEKHRPASFDEYEQWHSRYPGASGATAPAMAFGLEKIREDGYREYGIGS